MDNDGVPAWMDTDTDGDGLLDAEEGTLDKDKDGLPDFADYDGAYTGGCVGGQNAWIVCFLPFLFRRKTSSTALALMVVALVYPLPSMAVGPDAHNMEWLNIDNDGTGTPRMSTPTTLADGFSLGVQLDTGAQPLVEFQAEGTRAVVAQLTTLSIGGVVAVQDFVQIDVVFPMHLDVRGAQGHRAGIGDLRVGAKLALLDQQRHLVHLALHPLLWIPTGNAVLHHGSGAVAGGGVVSLGQSYSQFHWSVNTGIRVGPTQAARNLSGNSGLLLGLASGVTIRPSVRVYGELIAQGSAGWSQLPAEFGAGTQFDLGKNTSATLALYGALTEAPGVPQWRIVFSSTWKRSTPRPVRTRASKPEPMPVAAPPDAQVASVPEAEPPSPRPAAEIKDDRIIIHEQIQFQEGSANLEQKNQQPVLLALLGLLSEHPEIEHLLIIGHTNHRGSLEVNQALSEARAKSVANWLVANGISPDRLLHKGYGSSRPIVPPTDPNADTINRRVEFKVLRE